MNDGLSLLVGYFIAFIIVFLICVFITRAIFSIPTIVEYQKKQYMMLRQIAHKLGVEEEKIIEVDDPEEYLRQRRLADLKAARERKE